MNILKTFNANNFEPSDYEIRETVKGVVVNENNEVLLLKGLLLGGGIEQGENHEIALAREIMEEAGAEAVIVKSLGTVVQYRDALRKKYIIYGYLCNYIRTASNPTTTQEDEQGTITEWKTKDQAISDLLTQINEIETKGPSAYEGDTYQSKLYNRKTSVIFLQESMK